MRPPYLSRLPGVGQVAQFHTTRTLAMPRLNQTSKRLPQKKSRQLPDDWEPFRISETLLDLDAWESRYAREYDESDRRKQQERWAVNPTKDELMKNTVEFRSSFYSSRSRFERLMGSKSTRKWRVNDLDILIAALQGVPHEERTARSPEDAHMNEEAQREFRQVLKENAIPPSVLRDGGRLLDWLLHRQSQVPMPPLPDLASLKSSISPSGTGETWSSFGSWRRLMISLLYREHALELVSQCTTEIASALVHFARATSSTELLSFLNSINSVLEQNHFDPGRSLGFVGVVLAAHTSQRQTARNYLTNGIRNGYWGSRVNARLVPISESLLDGLELALVVDDSGHVQFPESQASIQALLEEQSPLIETERQSQRDHVGADG